MQPVRGIRNVLAMSAPALLVVVVGIGCGGVQASSTEQLPDGSQPVATIVGDVQLFPGDQRAPDPARVTTTTARRPIGKPLRPVPRPAPTPTVPTATTTAPSS